MTSKKYEEIKMFSFHGLQLGDYRDKSQVVVECPFCGKKKFSIEVATGKWRCFVCKSGLDGKDGGNATSFMKLLYEVSFSKTCVDDYTTLAVERGLSDITTLQNWGVAKSIISSRGNTVWLIPGWRSDWQLKTVYKYESKKCMASPGHGSGLFGTSYLSTKSTNYWCEGPWDGMALYETMGRLKQVGSSYQSTADKMKSLLQDANIFARPGAGVWNDDWTHLAEGRENIILGDNDHPKKKDDALMVVNGRLVLPGFDGMRAGVVKLHPVSRKSYYLKWSKDGFDSELPDGYDLRDMLCKGEGYIRDRYSSLVSKIEEVPEDWVKEVPRAAIGSNVKLEECDSYEEMLNAWKSALKWSEGLEKALSCMLASVISVDSVGDQLWIKVLGPPSCGKSTLCEALAVNEEYVEAKSTFTGFVSGYNSGNGEDASLINKLNGKTFVTKDGDTLLQAPNRAQILSHARDIYDKNCRTDFRNNQGRDYIGVNLTWILCGTTALRAIDASELGDRFLDVVIMEHIDDDLEDDILLEVARRTRSNLSKLSSNGSNLDDNLERAYKLTGGYISYLRKNANRLLDSIECDSESEKKIARYGKFVAFMRSRGSDDKLEKKSREHAARLVAQLMRLAGCLAAVTGKKCIDSQILDRVRSVALDTSVGPTLEITKFLRRKGASEKRALDMLLHTYNSKLQEKVTNQLGHLTGLDFGSGKYLETFRKNNILQYRLSEKAEKLFDDVFSAAEE